MDNKLTHMKPNECLMKPIVAVGQYDIDGCWDINTSAIYSKLITDTGRFCENYASDILISLREVEKYIDYGCCEDKTFLFGIYQDGVDHTNFVLANYKKYKYYRALYRLDTLIEGTKLTMALTRIE